MWLAVPRKFTLPALLIVGAGLTQLAWVFASKEIIVWLAGLAVPFCVLCATAVWAMRDKVEDAFDAESMSAETYRRLADLADGIRFRSTTAAMLTFLAAFIAASPILADQFLKAVWQWMVIADGAACGAAVFAYLIAGHCDRQIRAQRSKRIYEKKRAAERQQMLNDLSRPVGKVNTAAEWQVEGVLVRPDHH